MNDLDKIKRIQKSAPRVAAFAIATLVLMIILMVGIIVLSLVPGWNITLVDTNVNVIEYGSNFVLYLTLSHVFLIGEGIILFILGFCGFSLAHKHFKLIRLRNS